MIGRVEDGRHAPGAAIVNNTIIVHPLDDPPDRPPAPGSVQKLWGPPPRPGAHSAWLMPDGQSGPTPDAKSWYWPTGGAILLDTRLCLFYTRMSRAGGDAKGTVWDFRAMNSTLAVIDNPGDDPAAWRPTVHDLGPIEREAGGRRINWGVAAVQSEGFVHVFGIDDAVNLNKRAVLARVEPGRIADFAQWRFWTGADWSATRDDAAAVCEAATDELSVHREKGGGGGGRWVMIHMEANLGRRIMVRTAVGGLTGPWSDPRVVYECPEPPTDKRLMVYAARAHPELSTPDELLLTYAVNSTDFWHMLANAEIYRLRVLRLPRRTLTP